MSARVQLMLLLIIFVPVFGAFLLPLAGRISRHLRNILALLMIAVSCVLSAMLIPQVLNGTIVTVYKAFPLGFDLIFRADKLAVFMALISSFISFIIVLFSWGYISHYDNQNEYYLMVVLFLGAMMGLVYSGSLIFLYVFWEITALACWRLIGFFRSKQDVLRADKAFLVTVFGALVMLIGFIYIYQYTRSFDLDVIRTVFKTQAVPFWAVALILTGILSKSATLPFHTWLPDAGVAPSPVTALLHAAVLVKIGVYVYARLFIATMDPGVFWHTAVPVIAAVSALVSAGAAMIDTDLKRIIAYSTVSQLAFIFLGLSIGNEAGVIGGLLYILMHGFAKAGLFLCAGVVEQNTKIRDITKLGGLIKTMPVTAVAFLLCMFSVMGIPPFGGFFSKYFVISGALNSGHYWISIVFLIGAFMTIIYLFRVFIMVFMGEPKTAPAAEKSPLMVFSVASLAFFSLVSGLLVSFPYFFAKSTVIQILELMK
jgi:proton-translocating NADH-quinone oxidoreductase chain N